MAARGLVANITTLGRDTGVSQAALVAPTAAGNYIAAGSVQTTNLQGILLQLQWGTTAGTLLVRAPGNGNNVAGNAQVSPYPSSAVFAQGAIGDLSYSWGTTAGTAILGPLTSDRFTQPDGNLYLDWVAGVAGVQYGVIQMPYNLL
jgi:hypothetical protein